MKVIFKTVTQESFELDINDDQTVLDIKNAIASDRGDGKFPAERQKLIYGGKILTDEQTFASLNYDEKRFIVLVLKPEKKVEEVPAESEKPVQEAPTPAKTPAAASSETPATPANRAPPLTTPQAPARTAAPLSEEHQEKLNNVMSMGYPENEALAALRAAFFDAERAVEYLINGVPDTVRAEGGYDTAMEGTDEEEPHVGLDFLQDNEQFTQLREIVRHNPDMLPEIIQQISQDNPALMQLIRENEQEFLALLNSDDDASSNAAEGEGIAPVGAAAAGGQQLPPNVIAITEADRDAINRLKEMGFGEQLVIEAYFACDKNEGLAVNYILSRMDDDIEDDVA
uniref:UV excision repair protein RAD23 n=1 Tax=Panagrolaimus sp. ES5 TaxID=591445 RepID=A0AC34FV72_9BILA